MQHMRQCWLIKGPQGRGPLSNYGSKRTYQKEHSMDPDPTLPGTSLTSADPLLLPGEDPWCVDDADALQHGVGQLGAHKPA